ncbi:MAG: hypothetical protein A2Y10_03540 [Planctomycetes bacterium GWF2_41_51]|nr:MAG: hypothetical protein A2Y10_03540 [Planctomycetes bacterium GWF2_41_51]HBG28946.1 D-lyxose/D-mannose family sugar isomerase [Phycisphaerales bacterium]
MKRNEVNKLIEYAKNVLHKNNIILPPFAYWSPADWKNKGPECDEIRKCMLGWDITDFGSNNFYKVGLVVFTLRNGHHTIAPFTSKPYAEKILIVQPDQHTPMHFHKSKMEDIINRCGGNLIIQLFNSDKNESLADTDIEISLDGVAKKVTAGSKMVLKPGESITIPPYLYHEFWADHTNGYVIAGEVSKVNDDNIDNRFLNIVGRFPDIEEDCQINHYLCSEYPIALSN